jgi:hypothetical protein
MDTYEWNHGFIRRYVFWSCNPLKFRPKFNVPTQQRPKHARHTLEHHNSPEPTDTVKRLYAVFFWDPGE